MDLQNDGVTLDDLNLGDISDMGLIDADLDPDAFALGPDLDDIAGFGPTVPTSTIKARYDRGTKHQMVRYDRAEALARDIGPTLLDEGGRVDDVLSGNFIFGDLFEAFAATHNLLIDELIISTLSVSQENIDSLANLIEGDYIRRLDLIVSDYWFSHNRRNVPYILEKLGHTETCAFRFAVSGMHTKIALLSTGDRKIVVSGSANMRSSRCIEAATFEHHPALYDFHRAYHDRIAAAFQVTGRASRGSDLFELIGGEHGI